ncbi:MAG: hypothetical protein HJJLKODD_00697 [Phycisphaerae bacterium]|nr:hypothetical protein [Phycisphaerae bacterium]
MNPPGLPSSLHLPSEQELLDSFTSELRRECGTAEWLGLDTGFAQLTEMLDGLQSGLIVLAGPPACGKTAFAKQLADQVADLNQVVVLFITYEQSAAELRLLSLARLAQMNTRIVNRGGSNVPVETLSSGPAISQRERLDRSIQTYARIASRIFIVEADQHLDPAAIQQLGAQLRQQIQAQNLLIVIDSLTAMPSATTAAGSGVAGQLSELRRVARSLRCPVVVLAAQTRSTYQANIKPGWPVFDEQWQVEYHADVAGVLWNSPSSDLTKGETRSLYLYLLKNRAGQQARIAFLYTPTEASFLEYGVEPLTYLDIQQNRMDSSPAGSSGEVKKR